MSATAFSYILQLADNSLILGQRNSEWCGHGPVLEQDIAITNISLDLLGQARNLFQYAAELFNGMTEEEKNAVDSLLPRPWKEYGRPLEEDDLAFLRDEHQYRNLLICELPKGDWAFTILRQYFFSSFQFLQFRELQKSNNEQLAAIAEKSIKETAYHVRWSGEWVIRLGDGTEESSTRIKNALDECWPFTGEMFKSSATEKNAFEIKLAPAPESLEDEWKKRVNEIFEEALLTIPSQSWMQSGGKQGQHTEYLGYMLAEMQHLQRTFPNAKW